MNEVARFNYSLAVKHLTEGRRASAERHIAKSLSVGMSPTERVIANMELAPTRPKIGRHRAVKRLTAQQIRDRADLNRVAPEARPHEKPLPPVKAVAESAAEKRYAQFQADIAAWDAERRRRNAVKAKGQQLLAERKFAAFSELVADCPLAWQPMPEPPKEVKRPVVRNVAPAARCYTGCESIHKAEKLRQKAEKEYQANLAQVRKLQEKYLKEGGALTFHKYLMNHAPQLAHLSSNV